MEDLKTRLKNSDINIRSRCLQKLLNAVKKKTKGNVINASSVQVPELSLILETCESDSAVTSNLAVQVIISLVMNKCMNTDYAIMKLLGCMKSPCNYLSVINGISSLLIYELNQASDSKTLKYSLLFPKHPLIAAVENKDDCFPFIIESVSDMLSTDYNKTVQVMEPLICFILCNPMPKQDLNYCKVLLLKELISRGNNPLYAVHLVLKFVPLMQVESVHKTAEIAYFIKELHCMLAKMDAGNQDFSIFIEFLLLIAFCLVERSVVYGHNPLQMIDLLEQLCPFLTKLNKSSTSVNICLVLIAYLLKFFSNALLDKICQLGIKLLEIADVSPTVAAFVSLSVIHTLPEASRTLFNNNTVKSSLSKFLSRLESVYFGNETLVSDSIEYDEQGDNLNAQSIGTENTSETLNLLEAFTPVIQTAVSCARFSELLDRSNINFKLKWLKSVKLVVDSNKEEDFEMVFSLVSALFLMAAEHEILLTSCFETMESLLIKAPELSTRVFSLLLYKMSCVEKPKSKFLILNFLPKSATHKYSIPPVLSVLQMMTNEMELKAHAIHLMLQLWKKQSRCFPQLHSLLTETNKSFTFDSGVNEILVAQAAAVLEICSSEPEKHGHEFLNILSTIFNKCNDEATSPVACLAIDGIISLCRSEIIDIRSTWKALSVRLSRDKRVLVSCRMYQLLSLIPALRVKSFDYDKFMSETVACVWKQLSSNTLPPDVIAEAYKALAKFPMDCHVLKLLPLAAKSNLKLPASMKATPFEMSKLPEDVLSYIPGYCFVDLLASYENQTILEGYVSFLHSLLKMEVEELPRSAYSQTRHVSKRKKVSEALNKVPEFLCTHFHSRKSPALQKNLAVGVLLCYEPPLEMDKDGFPIKRSIATQSRSYEQVLTVLINEVNIDTTEWHRCVLTSGAWCSFMERAFFACEEARRAELELQRAHGHLDLTPDALNEQCKLAWLWVRDRFLGIIKTNAKSAPTAHANAVFAISGLVFALNKFHSSLDEHSKALADENEKYINHRHFVAEYVETIICAMNPEYQPTGKVQSWLLTHLSRPNSSAGYLVTGCASSSLCHLAPVLISHYANDIASLFEIMLRNMSHTSSVLNFYSGKGIGLLVKILCEMSYFDSGEAQVNLLLHVVREMMKIYEDSESSRIGCLIGLTISLTSLSQVMNDDIKDWISTTCNIFYEKLMDEEKSSMQFEMLCICVTAMIISAVEGSCLPIQNVEDLVSWIEMNKLELPQCSGISVSLGMLIEAYERFGHSESREMKQKVLKTWFNTVTSERKPTLQKIAALNGLCSLFSCGRGLMQVKPHSTTESLAALNDLLPVMFQILSASRDTGLQSICCWEVGRLFSVHANQQQTESSVSATYSYLGEKSILKPVMNVIISYNKKEETTFKNCHVLVCLKALASPFPRPLPPINWVTILTPFLQQSEELEAVENALKIAVYQCNGSSYAMNIVFSCCNPPLIHTLPEPSFRVLLNNMHEITLALPPAKLQVYLLTIITLTLKKDDMLETVGNKTLQGLLKSLKQTGYKEQSRKILQDAFISVLKHFKTKESYMIQYLPWIAEAILLLPDDVQTSQLQVSGNVDEVAVLTMIWCYFIKTGKKSISNLRSCIEEGKCCSPEYTISEIPFLWPLLLLNLAKVVRQKNRMCLCIYDCFLEGYHNEESELSKPSKCIAWFFETIGWIRVLEETKSKYQLISTSEVYTFLMDVCFAMIIGCSGLENSYCFLPRQSIDHRSLLETFPQAINALSKKIQWCEITDKIIEWLLMLLKSQYVKQEDKYYIKLSLCSLRSTSHFQKKEIWTEVICNSVSVK